MSEQFKAGDKMKYEQGVKYPLFKRWEFDGEIVMFTGLTKGETVWAGYHEIGYTSETFTEHTSDEWEDVAYDADRGLWDGQPVLAWYTYMQLYVFYDAVHKCAYTPSGKRDGTSYYNYEAIPPKQIPEWMIEAYKTSER